MSTANARSVRSRLIVCATRSAEQTRLASPVSGSWSAWCASWTSRRLCSVSVVELTMMPRELEGVRERRLGVARRCPVAVSGLRPSSTAAWRPLRTLRVRCGRRRDAPLVERMAAPLTRVAEDALERRALVDDSAIGLERDDVRRGDQGRRAARGCTSLSSSCSRLCSSSNRRRCRSSIPVRDATRRDREHDDGRAHGEHDEADIPTQLVQLATARRATEIAPSSPRRSILRCPRRRSHRSRIVVAVRATPERERPQARASGSGGTSGSSSCRRRYGSGLARAMPPDGEPAMGPSARSPRATRHVTTVATSAGTPRAGGQPIDSRRDPLHRPGSLSATRAMSSRSTALTLDSIEPGSSVSSGPTALASRRSSRSCLASCRPPPAPGSDVAEGTDREYVGYLPEHDCLPTDISANDFVNHMVACGASPRAAARERTLTSSGTSGSSRSATARRGATRPA